MALNPAEANEALEELKANVKAVNGVFVPLWHNHTISDQGEWNGWKAVFESSLNDREA